MSQGALATVIFLWYPLITYNVLFMAQVFITTLLIAHWLNDEVFFLCLDSQCERNIECKYE